MASATIPLFDADPELLELVPEAEREFALRGVHVTAHRLPVGPLDLTELGRPQWGMLVVEGLVACEIGVAERTSAELLGTGDLLPPVGEGPPPLMVHSAAVWTVLEPVVLVALDERFLPAVRRWPQITICLLDRTHRRGRRLAVAQAIGHLTRVDTRVLAMLWVLAERWGRVSSDAIVLPLRLTHRTLARLVGARRPSVTTAISDLSRRGLVSRRHDGAWLLHGAPPQELEAAGLTPEIVPAPPRTSPVGEHARVTALAAQIRVLTAAYEDQAERARTLATVSEAVRGRSRELRVAHQAQRLRRRRPDAPPSA